MPRMCGSCVSAQGLCTMGHVVEWSALYSSNGVVDGLCGLVWRSRMCMVLWIIPLGCMCIVRFKLENLAVFRWARGSYQWLPSLVNHAVSCATKQDLEGDLSVAGQFISIAHTLGTPRSAVFKHGRYREPFVHTGLCQLYPSPSILIPCMW